MASRYWVGGGGTWDSSSTTHWSASSGGGNGASVPTTSDDVYFDANSGGGTVTLTGTSACKCLGFDTTGFTGSFASNAFQIVTVHGSITLGTSQTTGIYFAWRPDAATVSLTSNGSTFIGMSIGTTGSVFNLNDNMSMAGSNAFDLSAGTFNANNHNISSAGFLSNGTTARTVNMGTGTWTMTANVWNMNATGLTLNASTSTIKFTEVSSTARSFIGGSQVYNNFWMTGAGTGTLTVTGSNTFNDFKVDTPPRTITFTAGTTQTVSSFTVSGTAGNLMTLQSSASGNSWGLSKSSGTASVDYVSLQDSAASGGATFFAGSGSTNVSGNTGWAFALVPLDVTDSLSASEQVTTGSTVPLSVSDSVSLSEFVTLVSRVASDFDQISITEAVVVEMVLGFALSDSVSLAEGPDVDATQFAASQGYSHPARGTIIQAYGSTP